MDPDRTAAAIAAAQQPDGAIPHYPGGPTDPWNHVEAAMGLDTVGKHAEAAAALRWLAKLQNPDGSWYAEYDGPQPTNTARDTNFSAYHAVGAYHHFLSTGDINVLDELWPTVDRAIPFVLSLQQPTGDIRWRQRSDGTITAESLVTGCSSIHHALRCAIAIAHRLGHLRPDWTSSADLLRAAIAGRPEVFAAKPHAMDWYYPVLCGVITGSAAARRLDNGWRRFVEPDQGIRCVEHEPWVTVAETAEAALTLAVSGNASEARSLLKNIEHLETPFGDFWTGYNYESRTIWPREHTTWTAAAVLLAHAAIASDQPTIRTFRQARGV